MAELPTYETDVEAYKVYNISYWDVDEDTPELSYTDMDEAVEYYLDSLCVSEWPDTLEVYAWARMPITGVQNYAERVVENLLEMLDEDHKFDDYTDPTTEMVIEARNLVNTIIDKHYCNYFCEQVARVGVDVAKWVPRHTSWAEEDDVKAWLFARGVEA
jgi:hypothetical protein